MKTAIATDTNSGIVKGDHQNIYVLPMPVIIDGQMYFEGENICHQELYEAMKRHRDISTSQPSPGQLTEFWDGILKEGYDEIVYIPMSSGLSGSCYSAIQFSQNYNGRIHVVDNHRISVTQRESVYAALYLAEKGYSGEEIKDYLEKRAYDASIYISVDSFEYLKKGGRITSSAAAFATVLNIKPVLTIQGDKLDAYAKTRGMKKAEAAMLKAVKQDRVTRFSDIPDSGLELAVAGTLESEQAQKSLQMMQTEFPGFSISYVDLPCSIACHVGMNAVGFGIMKKEIERSSCRQDKGIDAAGEKEAY